VKTISIIIFIIFVGCQKKEEIPFKSEDDLKKTPTTEEYKQKDL